MNNLTQKQKQELAINLLHQIMEMEKARDAELCLFYIKMNKATKTVGQSQISTSLQALEELIKD